MEEVGFGQAGGKSFGMFAESCLKLSDLITPQEVGNYQQVTRLRFSLETRAERMKWRGSYARAKSHAARRTRRA
jgi:hypothetical protein